jgi:hypothetical protein
MPTPTPAAQTTRPRKTTTAQKTVGVSVFSSASKNRRFQLLTAKLMPTLTMRQAASAAVRNQARRAVAPVHQPAARAKKSRKTLRSRPSAAGAGWGRQRWGTRERLNTTS